MWPVGVCFVEDGRDGADREFTHVTVQLKSEPDIVNTLIAAAIANSHSYAVRKSAPHAHASNGAMQLC